METKAEEVKKVEEKSTTEEFVALQYIVSVELKFPFNVGKRKVSWIDITTSGENGVVMGTEELHIETNVDGQSEHIPRENVIKRRERMFMIPQLEGHEFGSYEYRPYTYPQKLDGYIGSYSNENRCLGFLDIDMQITMMADLEA